MPHTHIRLRTLALLSASLMYLVPGLATADERFTPWDVARIKTVTSVVPSPDGSKVAYLLAVPRDPFTEADGPAMLQLHVVDVASGADTTFVASDSVGQPR